MRATKGIGADDEVRTRDIQIGNLKLYQLSYVRAVGLIAPRSANDKRQFGRRDPRRHLAI